MRSLAWLGVVAALSCGCTAATDDSADDDSGPTASRPAGSTTPGEPTPTPTAASEPTTTATSDATPSAAPPARIDVDRIRADVRHLAGRIGPRHATSPAYRRAADWVAQRFTALGYDVSRQRFDVPAGDSWGVPVDAGRSSNVIADPPRFDPRAPHLVVGAHLDTVAVAPGAEDNASGVASVLEIARVAATNGTRLPVRFVAFGAEEPRGPGDDLHHFGSQHLVATLGPAQREAVRGMASLDRVGVRGPDVPICDAGQGPARVRRALVERAGGVPTSTCEDRASDHWSYAKAGIAAARIGSIPYAGYHSAGDVPRVVDDRQLRRSATVAWRWIKTTS